MTEFPVPEPLLRRYATGSASPGLALLVGAQLDIAEEGRAVVADFEAAGGALLRAAPAAEMSAGALDRVLSALDAPVAASPPPPDPGPLPQRVAIAAGCDFASIPWRFRLPGLSVHEIPGYGPEEVSLMRARPGCALPQHTHEGEEATLVITGAMEDGGAIYRRGDLSLTDERHDHRPRIVGDEICYCLVVLSGSLRFTGLFSRALNYL
ncbi:cupin domain-containing protein [Paralimibaculum aggregatum]|nr:cupin domain-containing protein [Limibaculum sp. NKW23]